MNDTQQTLIRALVKVGSGYLIAKGWADKDTAEIAGAGVAAIIAIIWGVLHRKPTPPVVKPIGPEPVTPPQQ